MAAKYKLEISAALDELFTAAAAESQVSKEEIVRRSLQLFIVSHKAIREGNKVGIVSKSGELLTEFVGL